MAYYHNRCDGQIKWYPFLPIRPRCQKCGKTWNSRVIYKAHVDDMTYVYDGISFSPQKGKTSYAAWADSPNAPPGVADVASHLPNWPRKWRFISFFGTITLLSFIFYALYLISFWAIIIGAVVFAFLPFIIIVLVALIYNRRRG